MAGLAAAVTVHVNPRHHLTLRAVPPTGRASTAAVCPTAPTTNTGSVLGKVVLIPPDGFTRQPDQAVQAGVRNAAQVAAVSQQPGQASAELGRDGFEGAVGRVWINAGAGEQAQVLLIEFTCHRGASEYFNSQLAGSYQTATFTSLPDNGSLVGATSAIGAGALSPV
ncbi:MAG: hypothetical protein M3137_20130 [Actinomycetota bacterium]|nr:hypothetical protein [Actinomycetota bacterium]